LRRADDPLVVDLGFGATPVTTVELARRLRTLVRADVEVVGLEIDPARVSAARRDAADGLTFAVGGFEVPLPRDRRPTVIRAFNVLRQYDEGQVPDAWRRMVDRLAPGGLLVEGTCDETGRRAAWAALHAEDAGSADGRPTPRTLTLAAHLGSLDRPSSLAERLPKALIHRNVPGEPVHALLAQFDRAWAAAAPVGAFGARQRWVAALTSLRERGTVVLDGPRRWRLGEATFPWPGVA
jgi:hypothetical protein